MAVSSTSGERVDAKVFILSSLMLLAVIDPLVLFPESGPAMVSSAFSFATNQFGWLYLLAGFVTVAFLIGLAFSRFGNVRLGAWMTHQSFLTSAGSR